MDDVRILFVVGLLALAACGSPGGLLRGQCQPGSDLFAGAAYCEARHGAGWWAR